jgi:hypothetical protein
MDFTVADARRRQFFRRVTGAPSIQYKVRDRIPNHSSVDNKRDDNDARTQEESAVVLADSTFTLYRCYILPH